MNKSAEHRKSKRFEHKATMRVLIFEDNDILRSRLKHLLGELGQSVYQWVSLP
jgi:CheY-like chemotaxis protein